MHEYSVDGYDRRNTFLLIGALGVGLAYLTTRGLEALDWEVWWWVDAPASIGYAAMLFTLFDRYVWSWNVLHRLGFVQIPDLGGDWLAQTEATGGEHATPISAQVTIRQRWTRIGIEMEGVYSTSRSTAAAIRVVETTPELTYVYRNEPWPDAPGSMVAHVGTAFLRVQEGYAAMRGEYYTGRTRHTFGGLRLQRSKRHTSA